MTPGPTIVRKCSACGTLIAELTIASGNTCGARFWTDGKREAPMLPDALWLVKCAHCGALIWINEQKKVGELGPWAPRGKDAARFRSARPPAAPSLDDYFAALSAPIADAQKERYIRLRAWWAGNDCRRQSGHAAPMSDQEIANLRTFLPFLDDADENDRVMKAEVLRELGMFRQAESLLLGTFTDCVARAAAIIRDLVSQQVAAVREMAF